MIREKVSLGIEQGADSEHSVEISETAEGRSSHGKLFLEIENQALRFGSLKAFEA